MKQKNKESVNIKLNDLLPKNNVKGGQEETVFGIYDAVKTKISKESLSP